MSQALLEVLDRVGPDQYRLGEVVFLDESLFFLVRLNLAHRLQNVLVGMPLSGLGSLLSLAATRWLSSTGQDK